MQDRRRTPRTETHRLEKLNGQRETKSAKATGPLLLDLLDIGARLAAARRRSEQELRNAQAARQYAHDFWFQVVAANSRP